MHRSTNEPWSHTKNEFSLTYLYESKSPVEKVRMNRHFQASWASHPMRCLFVFTSIVFCRQLDDVIGDLCKNFAEGTEYFKVNFLHCIFIGLRTQGFVYITCRCINSGVIIVLVDRPLSHVLHLGEFCRCWSTCLRQSSEIQRTFICGISSSSYHHWWNIVWFPV